MAQGLHVEGQNLFLELMFRAAAQPDGTTQEFKIRLANSLLLRLTGTAEADWTIGETVQGSTSSDTGTLAGIKTNGDGSVSLELSGIGQSEVFSIGETISGQTSAASGILSNSVLGVSGITGGTFQINEQIVDQTSGATADIKGTFGSVLELNNVSGDFGQGNTVEGQESGASASVGDHYAGVPGLFKDDGVVDILDEAVNYTPVSLAANSTDWATLSTDALGNVYIQTREMTFEAIGGDLGPVNLGILTVNIDGGGEEIISSAPIKGTPPSEVVNEGGNLLFTYEQKISATE